MPAAVISAARDEVKQQTGADQIQTETITRFTRNQVIQLVLLVALVYVAYPFISTVPTFFSELRTANWWWALLGLAVSALTYVGAAAALWACADGLVSFRNLTIMQVANTFAATTTPAGVGGLALSTRFLQKGGLGARARHHGGGTAADGAGGHPRGAADLLQRRRGRVGRSVPLRPVGDDPVPGRRAGARRCRRVPVRAAGCGAGSGRRCGRGSRRSVRDLVELAREPKRLALIVLGCAATTLGMALALWASVEAFGGGTTFVTVTVVTMIGGTLASAAPTPGGVGAVEAALIGGLAAFGVPAAVGVPSVLLYRVLTCWLPVFVGWPIMRWLTRNEMI